MMPRTFICLLLTSYLALSPCRLAADLDPRDSESPYGVLSFLSWSHDWNNFHYDEGKVEEAARLMKEAGIGFVRLDFLWDDIEPSPGEFTFEKYDRIVETLGRYDIKVLGLLSYNAVWAAEYWNSAPKIDLFVRYARAVVERYKANVKYWEVWNEPDDAGYWREQDSLKTYTELLKAVYTAAKEIDPTCRILMGGVSKTIAVSLKNIYRNGGREHFDIVNMHPFVDPKVPGASTMLRGIYEGMRKVMEAYGDTDKEIWITEVGCPGVRPDAGESGWWLGKAPTEEEQAAWLRKVYNDALGMKGVRKVFWAFFQDTPDYFKNAVDHFGLIRNDFSKKPAFEIYKKLIRSKE